MAGSRPHVSCRFAVARSVYIVSMSRPTPLYGSAAYEDSSPVFLVGPSSVPRAPITMTSGHAWPETTGEPVPTAGCSSAAGLTLTALAEETLPATASAARTTPKSADMGLFIVIDGPPASRRRY